MKENSLVGEKCKEDVLKINYVCRSSCIIENVGVAAMVLKKWETTI